MFFRQDARLHATVECEKLLAHLETAYEALNKYLRKLLGLFGAKLGYHRHHLSLITFFSGAK
ncbi:MAG: hypothetical protein ACI9J2_002495 [Saprospiraceae bacterium]